MAKQITLIIPDIHNNVDWAEKIVRHVCPDLVVFLGDYFDSRGDTPEVIKHTAEWLVSSVSKPNRVHLWGNHDVSYGFPYDLFRCSGTENWKKLIISDIVDKNTWNKLLWYYNLDNTFLLTHSGIHTNLVPDNIKNSYANRTEMFSLLGNFIESEVINGIRLIANGVPSGFLNAGSSRGGHFPQGGIIWCDFYREFTPIKGINQIFGHTRTGTDRPLWYNGNNSNPPCYIGYKEKIQSNCFRDINRSFNLNLNTRTNLFWATWDGSEIDFGDYINDVPPSNL